MSIRTITEADKRRAVNRSLAQATAKVRITPGQARSIVNGSSPGWAACHGRPNSKGTP